MVGVTLRFHTGLSLPLSAQVGCVPVNGRATFQGLGKRDRPQLDPWRREDCAVACTEKACAGVRLLPIFFLFPPPPATSCKRSRAAQVPRCSTPYSSPAIDFLCYNGLYIATGGYRLLYRVFLHARGTFLSTAISSSSSYQVGIFQYPPPSYSYLGEHPGPVQASDVC